MTARSYFRGHPTYWDEQLQGWRYTDTGEPIPGWGGEIRPCAKCGAVFEMHEPDACLGQLPGVDNACCGHGVPDQAYIRFTSHVVVRGFTKGECCGKETKEVTMNNADEWRDFKPWFWTIPGDDDSIVWSSTLTPVGEGMREGYYGA